MVLYFRKNQSVLPDPQGVLLKGMIIYTLLWISPFYSFSQINPFTSAYNAALLNADRFDADADGAIIQPSILPDVSSPGISANCQSLFSGFDVFSIGLHVVSALPGNFGFGVSVVSLGNPDYRLSEYGVGVGRKLGERMGIGVSQRVLRARVADEGRPWSGTTAVAASYDAESWGLAFRLSGLMPWRAPAHHQSFAAHLASYLEWASQTRMYFVLGYGDSSWEPVVGIRQKIIEKLEIFGAFQIYPARYGLGIAVPLGAGIQSVISTQFHPVLGWSPSLGVRLKRKGEGN